MVELSDIISMQSADDIKKDTAVKELFKFKDKEIDIKTKTELSIEDIKKLTRLKLISQTFNIPIIDSLCNTFCLFLVSKNRAGRTEIVDMIQPRDNDGEKSKTFFNKIFKK